ncbi:MAG: FtsX-like permease family protein [Lautropia sp.]|nr:FtsX-like permease family protein [Lautropia sp.]
MQPSPRQTPRISAFGLSRRFLRRDFRAGELHLLSIALIVAVSAIATVGFFVDRLNQALSEQATQLLGGDLVLVTDRPVPSEWETKASSLGLRTASTVGFPSMAIADADGMGTDAGRMGSEVGGVSGDTGNQPTVESLPVTQLASVLAVSDDYPLRGALTVSSPRPVRTGLASGGEDVLDAAPGAADHLAKNDRMPMEPGQDSPAALPQAARQETARGAARTVDQASADHPGDTERLTHGPAPGTVWVDEALAQALGLHPGQRLVLGDSRLSIARLILMEPARGASFVNFAPRLMMSLQDLPASGLAGPGARLNYRFLVAGDRTQVAAFQQWLAPRLGAGQRLETLEEGRPEMQTTLVRARQFLALVSLLSALIAAVAIGLAARRFAERHLDGFAVLKAMGVGQPLLARALILEMLWLALGGGLVAVAIGWLAHYALTDLANVLLTGSLPPASWWPAGQALLVAVVLIVGFAAVPILRLADVTPLRVLRRELGAPGLSVWLVLAAAVVAFAALLLWLVAEPRLALLAMTGFVLAGLGFLVLAGLVVRLSARLRPRSATGRLGLALRLALTGWSRRLMMTVTQAVALAIGLMAMLLLTVVRNDLLTAWQRVAPADAPNRFVINIQPDQADQFQRILEEGGIGGVVLYPMVRGRLVAVNDRAIGSADFEEDRARRLVDREFNLSYGTELPVHNRQEAGRWIRPGAAEVSAEAGIMETLGLSIGDRLRFDVAGQPVEVTLVGSRGLRWDSMQVNFFMITTPDALEDQPQSLITSFHLPADRQLVVRRLLAAMPNLTVIDTGVIAAQIQAMIAQVVQAVQFLFAFTVLAGLVVLYAAMGSVRDERVAEVALMRALGAGRRQLLWAQLIELSLTGLLAGLMATLGAAAVGWLLATEVFDFAYQPAIWLLLAAVLGSTFFVVLAGGWNVWRLLDTPPLRALRGA